jgi:putative nudix hydrolase
MRHGWKKTSQKTVYKGRVHIIDYEVKLDDNTITHYEVDHNEYGAAACLVRLDKRVILTYQYRFPLNRWIYDLPGGGRMKGETFEDAARRECREEIGINPENLIYLAEFYPNPGRSDWPVHIFFCDSHSETDKISNNPSEIVYKKTLQITELERMVDNNEIIDPSLLIAWHTARKRGLV